MTTMYSYRSDQELPDMVGTWLDGDGQVIDLSTGWTLTARVAAQADPTRVLLTKTVVGAADAPNWRIAWDVDELAALPAEQLGTIYVVHLYARRDVDDKDRVFSPAAPPTFMLLPAPTEPPT